MPRRTTMQQLYSEIQAEHVRSYLLYNDWQLAEPPHAESLLFEKIGTNDQPCQIWIWTSRDRPKFVNRIQNLLFSLSVIEGREPLEIGNAILDSVAPVAVSPNSRAVRFCIRNVYEHAIDCAIEGSNLSGCRLSSGESLELVVIGPHHKPPEIRTSTQRIDVRCGGAESVHIYQGLPEGSAARSATQIVREELQRGGIQDDRRELLLGELSAMLTRADFELDTEDDKASTNQTAVRRQAAIVATTLAKQLSDSESSSLIVWWTTVRIAALANLRLALSLHNIAELFRLAFEDDTIAPAATASLLREISADFSPDA